MHTFNDNSFSFLKNRFIIYNHKYVCITIFCLATFGLMAQQNKTESFKDQQLKYERVRNAFDEKETFLQSDFEAANLSWPPKEIYLRAFKAEASLEVWVKQNEEFYLIKNYKICKNSGNFGPKRKEGDRQVPEGLYIVDRFNPISNFWLSLGINYPNQSDAILSDQVKPGGDIFIHGDCVTIGCLPLTDEIIKELYVLATLAKSEGQETINVHSFPFHFNDLNKMIFYKEFPEQRIFWNNLAEAYTYFELNNSIPEYTVDENGMYIFKIN